MTLLSADQTDTARAPTWEYTWLNEDKQASLPRATWQTLTGKKQILWDLRLF
jgi:hypothetical protein